MEIFNILASIFLLVATTIANPLDPVEQREGGGSLDRVFSPLSWSEESTTTGSTSTSIPATLPKPLGPLEERDDRDRLGKLESILGLPEDALSSVSAPTSISSTLGKLPRLLQSRAEKNRLANLSAVFTLPESSSSTDYPSYSIPTTFSYEFIIPKTSSSIVGSSSRAQPTWSSSAPSKWKITTFVVVTLSVSKSDSDSWSPSATTTVTSTTTPSATIFTSAPTTGTTPSKSTSSTYSFESIVPVLWDSTMKFDFDFPRDHVTSECMYESASAVAMYYMSVPNDKKFNQECGRGLLDNLRGIRGCNPPIEWTCYYEHPDRDDTPAALIFYLLHTCHFDDVRKAYNASTGGEFMEGWETETDGSNICDLSRHIR